MPSEQHLVTPFIYILGPSRHKIYKDMFPLLWKSINKPGKAAKFPTLNSSLAFYRTNGQTFRQTLSKRVNLLVSYSMLPNPMQSYIAVSVKYQDQDSISR